MKLGTIKYSVFCALLAFNLIIITGEAKSQAWVKPAENGSQSNFKEIVKSSLGAGYDQFDKLEELCKPKEGAGTKEFKESQGI